MIRVLRIVNAALHVEGNGELYELQAADGVWQTVRRQDGYVHDASALPITRLNDLHPVDAILAEGAVPAQSSVLPESAAPVGGSTPTQSTIFAEGNGLAAEIVTLDLEGRMLLPGLVDAHMHLDKAFSLPAVPNESGTLLEAIRNYKNAAKSFPKEVIRARIVRTALQALRFGTTALRSHLDFHVQEGPEVALRTVEAALEARELLKPYIDIQYFPMFPYQPADSRSAETARLFSESLAMGMDGVGGAPHLSETAEADISFLFDLAARHGCPIDLHADETDDPSVRTVLHIAAQTKRYGYEGKATVGHLCSLSAMPQSDADRIMEEMAAARLKVVTLPAANLYLQGRGDRGVVRRGVTRVKELIARGIPLAAASDNIHDPFHPFGRGDLLQIALLTGYAAHMGSPAEMRKLLRMITTEAAEVIGLADYGLRPGGKADFVILDARSPEEVFTMLPPTRWVAKRGCFVSITATHQQWGNPHLEKAWAEATARVGPRSPSLPL